MAEAADKGPGPRNRPAGQAVRLILPFLKQYGFRLVWGFAALLGVDFLQLWMPRFIKRAVDALEAGTATGTSLLRYAGFILLLAVGIACCRFVWRYLILGFSRLLERDLRDWLFSHLLGLDRLFFQRHSPGAIMALATNDLAAVQLASGMGLVAFVDAVVMTAAALAFMAYINLDLTLIAFLPMPILALLTRFLAAKLHLRFGKVQEQFGKMMEFARSSLSFIRLYKAYTQEKAQTARFDVMGREYVRDNLRLAGVQGVLFPVAGLVANISLLLVVFFGGRLTIQGKITVGDFVAFIVYLSMLTWPMMALGWVTNLFQRGLTSLHRVQEILEARPVLEDHPTGAAHPARLSGVVSLRHLSFSYPGQRDPALRDVSLDFRPGITGIVGRIGSGKTTLCHLLARLYPVKDNALFYDGRDGNSLSLSLVRGGIAYAPQDVTLFSDTIAANIALGNPAASRKEIEAAARAAVIHEEIMALPQAYESKVGEKGVKLSGGQRQRIALARALLLERPILIIDDGLSAVDMETEQRIIQSLGAFLTGRTCIIVSHRVAPLQNADTIVVLEKGRVAAQGGHADLLARNRFYATIHQYQTHGKEPAR